MADLRDRRALTRAARGVSVIYHICPNVSPYEVAIGRNAIAAAQSAGAALVYHSVLHPQTRAMPHHYAKLQVEELIFAAGLPYTILQPGPYMENVQAAWPAICREGVLAVPYSTSAKFSLVHLGDVARVAARVLTEPGHRGAIYELAGHPLSSREMAASIARVLRRPVRAQRIGLAAWSRQARRAGLSSAARASLLKMFRYYDRHGLAGNPRVLRLLLGRPPVTFAAAVRGWTAGGN